MLVSVHVAVKQESLLYPGCPLIKWMISFAIIIFLGSASVLLPLSPHSCLNVNHHHLDALYLTDTLLTLVPENCCLEKGQGGQTQLCF